MRAAIILAVAALGLVSSSLVRAETQEQRYFAVRDAAIAKVTAAMDAYTAMPSAPSKEMNAAPANPKATAQDKAKAAALEKAKAAALEKAKQDALDKVIAMDKAESAKLEQDMREIVGPISIAGFEKDGKINYDGLIKGDQGFGLLDGLIFTSADKKASVVVTTVGMFRHWLAEHKDWWGKNSNDIPQQPGIAVQQNAFYTQALRTDSAIVRLAELHVRKPLGTVFVFAAAGARTQDAIPAQANEIFIAVGLRGHVFIGQSRNIDAVGPIPACEGTRKQSTSPQTDDNARKKSEALYVNCFASRARSQPSYAGAIRAAQQMIDAVAAR